MTNAGNVVRRGYGRCHPIATFLCDDNPAAITEDVHWPLASRHFHVFNVDT